MHLGVKLSSQALGAPAPIQQHEVTWTKGGGGGGEQGVSTPLAFGAWVDSEGGLYNEHYAVGGTIYLTTDSDLFGGGDVIVSMMNYSNVEPAVLTRVGVGSYEGTDPGGAWNFVYFVGGVGFEHKTRVAKA